MSLELMKFEDLECETLPTGRYYITPDGKKYPSVTTVLGKTSDKDHLIKWRLKIGDAEADRITRAAAMRGNELHSLAERFVMGEKIDPRRENSLALALFGQIRPILLKNVRNIVGIEVPLYSDTLRIAGRSDLIAKFKGKRSIIDYKTSTNEKKKEWIEDYFIQSTIYAIAFKELTGISIDQVVIIIANENGDGPSVFIENVSDWVTVAHERVDAYYSLTSE